MAISQKPHQGRSNRINHSVLRALERWRGDPTPSLPEHTTAPPLSVRTPAPSSPTPERYRAGVFHTSLRLTIWIWSGIRFFTGIALDKLMRRDTLAHRAARLRRIFEGLGATFIKVAQQLSARADLLPIEYCQEFSRMLDWVPPFETNRAQEIVEQAIRAPLTKVFEEFPSEPIGSASLSCVYKARLRTGELVAVKVRRPGVASRLAADVRALGWLLELSELLSLFRPGFTKELRIEFARMLFEEIDFMREARNTELFRTEAIRAKQAYITAPRVHFELCSEEVLVTDFMTGVFLNNILDALDRGDEVKLQEICAQGIDLPEVARRLIMLAHWEIIEGLIFHADPHPANICVQPGNILVFLDFGSCGHLTDKYRRIWQRFYQEFANHNVQGMAAAALAILEPLPPVDIESFSRDIELMFCDWVHAINSDYSFWWEKASGLLWMKFADMARRYQVPMSAEIVRIFRARFLYDTTAFRLWDQLDMRREFRRYQLKSGKRAKRRIRGAFWRRMENGFTGNDYIEIEDLGRMGRQLIGRVQHYLDVAEPNFAREIGKLSYVISLALQLVALGLATYVGAVITFTGYAFATGRQLSFSSALATVAANQWYRVGLAAIALLLICKAIRKFKERDAKDVIVLKG